MTTSHPDRHLLLLAVMVWVFLLAVAAFIVGRMVHWPGRSRRRRGGTGEVR